jgi:alpha-galactosidase
MVFSVCEWGMSKPWEWAGKVAHSWRTTPDIYNCFDCEFSPGFSTGLGVLRILDKQAGLRKFAGPGHWNDTDMLEVGNGMSEDEDRAKPLDGGQWALFLNRSDRGDQQFSSSSNWRTMTARPLDHRRGIPATAEMSAMVGIAVLAAYLVDSTSTVTEYGAKL